MNHHPKDELDPDYETLPGAERHPDYESVHPLPVSIARSLGPTTREALNHSTRRAILRSLNRSASDFKTAEDLRIALPQVASATLTYHAGVLYHFGAVRMTVTPRPGGTQRHSFASDVVEDVEYHAALAATQALDAAAHISGS